MRYSLVLAASLMTLLASGALAAAPAGHTQGMDHTQMGHEMTASDPPASDERQGEISKRGETVMPFSLARTQHVFHKDASGGVQQVLARDRSDMEQIALIRNHLREIRGQFLRGNFSDPAAIHGETMPGLAVLEEAKPGDVTIDYQNLSGGGQLTFKSRSKPLIEAIHRWFDAQVSDHGKDAITR